MSSVQIQLRQEDAKLVFLAVAHHLGRPGSELDPITKQPVEHGLAEVARDLQPQLRNAVATVSLDSNQRNRLIGGMLGSITELKAYPMLQPRPERDGTMRRSSVPGFDRSLLHLFPEVEEDTEGTLDIAERMLMLKRRLEEETADMPARSGEPEPERKKSWWPFGKKS